jgi:hypothetical protein
LNFFAILCFEIGSNISRNPFLNLILHMSWIVIFHKIMSPSMDRRHNKVTYMLCIFKCTLSSGCRRFMIKLSNVCPCVLISMDCECFGSVWFQYVMVTSKIPWYGYYWFDILGRPSSFVFCNFNFFSMKSLKLIKTFKGGCIGTIFCIHSKFVRMYFLCIWCFHLQFVI